MSRRHLAATLALLLVLSGGSAVAHQLSTVSFALAQRPVSPDFTYQGRLAVNGAPANGPYDFQFQLYDAASLGNLAGDPATLAFENRVVTDGQYSVPLNFGTTAFTGGARWLQVGWRPGSSTEPYVLLRREPLNPVPYAVHSLSTGALRGRAVSTAAPASGQVLKWSGTAWTPTADANAVSSVGPGLSLSGGQASVTPAYRLPQQCASGQVAKSNGATWACANDAGQYTRTVVVSPAATTSPDPVPGWIVSGRALLNAFNSITTASLTSPYLLKIEPGIYKIDRALVMKPYVDIEGSGELTTMITASFDVATPTSGTVVGTNNAELRFLTVEHVGGVGIAIYNEAASPRLTHVTAIGSGGADQNIGVYNLAGSAPVMTDVTAKAFTTPRYGSATNANLLAGVSNDHSSPAMINVVATAAVTNVPSTNEQYVIGVRNIASSPTMTDVIATASGGGHNVGVVNNLSSSKMTSVAASGTGGAESWGVLNYSSSPIMVGVSATASVATESIAVVNDRFSAPTMTNLVASAEGIRFGKGIFNMDSFPLIHNSIITATGDTTSYGIVNMTSYAEPRPKLGTVDINGSRITGATSTIIHAGTSPYDQEMTSRVGATQLIGGAVQVEIGTIICGGVYDEDYVFSAGPACP